MEWQYSCTRIFFGDEALIQPAFYINEKNVCYSCATTCCSELLNNTPSIPRFQITCECPICLFQSRIEAKQEILYGSVKESIKNVIASTNSRFILQSEEKMLSQVNDYVSNACQYDNKDNQKIALQFIPFAELKQRAEDNKNRVPGSDELIKQLLAWFKNEFFHWINNKPCSTCNNKETNRMGIDRSLPEEEKYSAGIVELYHCNKCNTTTRFPRYNDAGKLMYTQEGEFAQAFTLCCRAIGFEARFINDFTDHVWTEIFSTRLNRWVHCDPCENAFDSPLLYEAGWGKKLNYIIASSSEEVTDVTLRYTQHWNLVLKRRVRCREEKLRSAIAHINSIRINKLDKLKKDIIIERQQKEQKEFLEGLLKTGISNREISETESKGRITGDIEWKKSRGELGNDKIICNKSPLNNNNETMIDSSKSLEILKRILSNIIHHPTEEKYHSLDYSLVMEKISPEHILLLSKAGFVDNKMNDRRFVLENTSDISSLSELFSNISMPSITSDSTSSPIGSKITTKEELSTLIKKFYMQIISGCNNDSCSNKYCHSCISSPYLKLNLNEAAILGTILLLYDTILAVKLAKDYFYGNDPMVKLC